MLIADAFAATPVVPLLTVEAKASILDEPADPAPYTSVSKVETAVAVALTPVEVSLTVFSKEVIA